MRLVSWQDQPKPDTVPLRGQFALVFKADKPAQRVGWTLRKWFSVKVARDMFDPTMLHGFIAYSSVAERDRWRRVICERAFLDRD